MNENSRRARTYIFALRQRWLHENQTSRFYFHELEESRESVESTLKWFIGNRNRIETVNVINDCFHLWYSGQFTTMNGFRLGRHTLNKVDWNEVNAALGDVMLLLVTVGFSFTRHVTENQARA
mmetsp:Transcript_7224/g.21317  ORF Transcript_7224/g.21317 Transcript_7224/m.21317 type:complete len:123 (+) Transcript_7224:77-445(+)